MSARIRLATRDDLAALLALEALFPSDRMTRASWRRFLASTSATALVLVERRAVIGNLLLLTRRGSAKARIYSVIVAPAARGRGLGEALVRRAEAEASRRACTALSLEVRADNPAARALYAKRGYAEVARLPQYYQDGAEGLRLCKQLPRGRR